MVRPRVADLGTDYNMDGTWEYIEAAALCRQTVVHQPGCWARY